MIHRNLQVPESKASGPPAGRFPRRRRIVRVAVYHRGTFRALLRAAEEAGGCYRYGGRYWELLTRGRSFAIYRPADDYLAWVQQRVEEYEFSYYRRLASGQFGRDGVLRPRSRFRRSPTGAYQPYELPGGPCWQPSRERAEW